MRSGRRSAATTAQAASSSARTATSLTGPASSGEVRKSRDGQIPATWRTPRGCRRFPISASPVTPSARGSNIPVGVKMTGSRRTRPRTAIGAAIRVARAVPYRRTTTISAGISGGTAHSAPPGPRTAMIAGDRDRDADECPVRPVLGIGSAGEKRAEREQRRHHHLLHAPPQVVAEEERGERGDDRDQGRGAGVASQPARELEKDQREHDGRDRHRGLQGERQVLAGDLGHHRHRHEGADRVAAPQVVLEDLLMGRGRFVPDRPAMLEYVVGDRQPGGVVVELDVAGPGRLAADEERARRRGGSNAAAIPSSSRPGQGLASRRPSRSPRTARTRISGSVSFAVDFRRGAELGDDDHRRHPERWTNGPGDAEPADPLHQQREARRGDEQRHRGDEPAENQVHGRRILRA